MALTYIYEETYNQLGWFDCTQTAAGWFDNGFSESSILPPTITVDMWNFVPPIATRQDTEVVSY